ncbi:hypothetical protein CDD80_410 [Ophiocordyceps camponoti-rufipedis]|uniref:Uncharacterized protein n=1 Tax=Ophiocordyceps camponoti-rufipedis TaxID=2004952 RepID=A0A2C5YLX0_9HYPO|nr:hypothetical protein CDD80_410 [Ophiocordyceps camponoti-rufipedis]
MHVTTTLALAGVASAAFNMAVHPSNPLLYRRADTAAYQPEIATCREGASCAEACGDGFEQCPALGAAAGEAHCVNVRARESCCMGGTGREFLPFSLAGEVWSGDADGCGGGGDRLTVRTSPPVPPSKASKANFTTQPHQHPQPQPQPHPPQPQLPQPNPQPQPSPPPSTPPPSQAPSTSAP